jgi:hypothetical protein
MNRSQTIYPIAALVWLSSVVLTAGRQQAPAPVHPVAVNAASGHPAMFAPSSECLACHNNLVAPSGEDISIGASWRGSIMANAARDPYFFASVRREVLDHPSRQAHIEDECAACHLPAAQKIARAGGSTGRVFAFAPGAQADGAERTELDRLAVDGVTCTVCHQIARDRLGTPESFNGNFAVAPPRADGRRRALGPHLPDPARTRLMHSVTGFEQEEAPHLRESEVCATCHTLITEAFGDGGRVIGSLHEQMNYQEWQHSAFVAERRGCQSCHMPVVQGPVRVSSVAGLDRPTLSRHTFLGGNAFMLRLMNRYRAELGIEATPAELEATARATIRQLEQDTAAVRILRADATAGTLSLDVAVTNLTGHKFPTGYPSRRAWLHVVVRDVDGRAVFESGRVGDDGAIAGNASDATETSFEAHFSEIRTGDQVQIYESIMGTPAGEPTTGLLRATRYLKDNRLLPRGFDKATAPPGIAVIGGAAGDEDFTGGRDVVRYRLAVAGGPFTIDVALRYQPIAFRWAQNLAAYDAPETRWFVNAFTSLAPTSSVVVARATQRTDNGERSAPTSARASPARR